MRLGELADLRPLLRGAYSRIGRGVGIVDRERHAPVGGYIRLIVGDRVERRDHVLEARGSAALRHPLAELGIALRESLRGRANL